MMGDPIVRKDIYINQRRILDVATPIRSPISEHTPKAFHSIKSLISVSLFMYVIVLQKYQRIRNYPRSTLKLTKLMVKPTKFELESDIIPIDLTIFTTFALCIE